MSSAHRWGRKRDYAAISRAPVGVPFALRSTLIWECGFWRLGCRGAEFACAHTCSCTVFARFTSRPQRMALAVTCGDGCCSADANNSSDANIAEVTTHDTAPTFKVRVNEVSVRVVVRDESGKVISNLKKEDFQLFDNRKPQSITSFRAGDAGNEYREGAGGDDGKSRRWRADGDARAYAAATICRGRFRRHRSGDE